jgi:hypothetical protein
MMISRLPGGFLVKRSTTRDERGELPTCAACGRPTGAGALIELDPEDGSVVFCDVRCREDYFTRMDQLRDGDPEIGEAA